MGTRSAVFRQTENGLEGCYVHWDGYPEHMVGALYELLRRDGYETVCRTLIDEAPNGWSSINPFQEDEPVDAMAPHIIAKKYWGRYYKEDIADRPMSSLTEARDSMCEYAYILVGSDADYVSIEAYDLYENMEEPMTCTKVLCDHEYDSYCPNCGLSA